METHQPTNEGGLALMKNRLDQVANGIRLPFNKFLTNRLSSNERPTNSPTWLVSSQT